MKLLLCTLITVSLTLVSCVKKLEEETTDTDLRWMDRMVYLAVPTTANEPDRNNIFQREAVKDALLEIESLTALGDGYFSFKEVEESSLTPSLSADEISGEQKSFILVWPDSVFADLMSDAGGNVPDQNALTVINSANKRKFFIVLKASCFASGNACGTVSPDGLKAIVARQFGLLVGLKIRDCNANPGNVMCNEPADVQWQGGNKSNFKASFDNALEVIKNTKDFYKTFNPNASTAPDSETGVVPHDGIPVLGGKYFIPKAQFETLP